MTSFLTEPLSATGETVVLAVVAGDDHVIARVTEALEREGVTAIVEHGGRERLAVDHLEHRPDVVILADGMATASNGGEIHRITRRLPDTHVVLVLPTGVHHDIRHMLDAGVEGIVLEPALETTLALVVRCVCAGQISVPRTVRHGLQVPALSYRERQILGLVTAGLSNEEIASRLFLAESTVKGHLTSAFRRLGVRTRHEAVALILTADESLRRSVLTARPGAGDPEPPRGR